VKKSILIIGATSEIGIETAKQFASNGYDLHLVARNREKLNLAYSELEFISKNNINFYEFDILNTESHKEFIESFDVFPNITLCFVGIMGDQKKNENNSEDRIMVMKTNFVGPVNFLSEVANRYEKKKSGTIVGVSSVAGERGRSTNYFYGASKSGMTTFLSGLRNRLSKYNVNIITVLPGPVFTKMNKNKNLPKFLTANTYHVAKDIFKAVTKKKDVIYSFKIWRYVMIFIKLIPESIFKKMKI
jgi:decaprenylphospho-beta-D-erythro-pentofuranosid-2-ulose 2-reductase